MIDWLYSLKKLMQYSTVYHLLYDLWHTTVCVRIVCMSCILIEWIFMFWLGENFNNKSHWLTSISIMMPTSSSFSAVCGRDTLFVLAPYTILLVGVGLGFTTSLTHVTICIFFLSFSTGTSTVPTYYSVIAQPCVVVFMYGIRIICSLRNTKLIHNLYEYNLFFI